MKKFFIKLSAPLFYSTLFIIIVPLAITVSGILSKVLEALFGESEIIIGVSLIFFLPVVVYLSWLANKIIQRIEKIKRPTIKDHFRQCLLMYFIFAIFGFTSIKCLITECVNDDNSGFRLIILFYLIIGIGVNAAFVIKLKKKALKVK